MTAIRPLRLLDSALVPLGNTSSGRNWAETAERLLRGSPDDLSLVELARKRLTPPRQGVAWVCQRRTELQGVASARPRSGRTSWEVDLLYLKPVQAELCPSLLEGLVADAGLRGAQRVFLRLPADSPLLDQVRRAGFMPCVRQTLYEAAAPAQGLTSRGAALRRRTPEDEYPLFRLYNQAVPASVRSVQGLTVDDWREAQELLSVRRRELVWEQEGTPRALVRIHRWDGAVLGELLMHPNYVAHVDGVLDAAFGTLRKRRVAWLVPEYQDYLGHHLEERGLAARGDYLLMVRPLVAMVRSRAAAPAGAPH